MIKMDEETFRKDKKMRSINFLINIISQLNKNDEKISTNELFDLSEELMNINNKVISMVEGK